MLVGQSILSSHSGLDHICIKESKSDFSLFFSRHDDDIEIYPVKKVKYEAILKVVKETEANEWVPVNFRSDGFRMDLPPSDAKIAPDLERRPTDMLDLFQRALPTQLLKQVWDSFPKDHWAYGNLGSKNHGHLGRGKYNEKLVYTYFAVFFQIVGKQDGPKATMNEVRPVREATIEALTFFAKLPCLGPKNKLIGYDTIEKMFSKPFFLDSRFHLTCERFQSFLCITG